MRPKQYEIKLTAKDRRTIEDIISRGTEKARKITRCRILLLSERNHSQQAIAEMMSVTGHTVRNICLRFIAEGLESAINEKPRSGAPGIFDGKEKAKITALACSNAPDGHSQWSLRLLADKAVELKIVDSISHTDVGRILKKMKSSRI